MADNDLLAHLLFFASREGDEATSPSCVAENEAIYGSSTLLEGLIAT